AADPLVTAEHHQRRKSVLPRLLGIRETELHRMLGRQERDDVLACDVTPEVRHEMAQVVLLLRTHRTVRQEDAYIASGKAANGMVRVDPCVHPFARAQLGT